ncbi:recombinase family protein [Planctomycetota bacterium]|nr:recombinase family protein [Planctomycetota bacterium]
MLIRTKMVFRMLAVLSEFERDQISERTKAALAHKKSLGQRVGQIPFGYQLAEDGITLTPDDTEQHVLGIIRRLHSAGYSQRKLVAALNRRGLLTKSGKAWNRNSLRSVLKRL